MNCNAMWEKFTLYLYVLKPRDVSTSKVYYKKVQMLNILGYAKVTLRCRHTYYTVQGPFKGFPRHTGIQWDYSRVTMCISNKQFLAKNFDVVH